jgi:hypothetical protein
LKEENGALERADGSSYLPLVRWFNNAPVVVLMYTSGSRAKLRLPVSGYPTHSPTRSPTTQPYKLLRGGLSIPTVVASPLARCDGPEATPCALSGRLTSRRRSSCHLPQVERAGRKPRSTTRDGESPLERPPIYAQLLPTFHAASTRLSNQRASHPSMDCGEHMHNTF